MIRAALILAIISPTADIRSFVSAYINPRKKNNNINALLYAVADKLANISDRFKIFFCLFLHFTLL